MNIHADCSSLTSSQYLPSAEAIYDEQADRKFRAGVDYDGSVQWVPGGKFLTSCQLDITLYPFDKQQCEMDFVDWTYDGRFVMLYNGSAHVGKFMTFNLFNVYYLFKA